MNHIIIDQKGNMKYHKGGDFHSMFGTVSENDIKTGIVKSNKDKKFIVFDTNFSDDLRNINRGPAVMHIKDIGQIIAYTGIGVGSVVVDAGAGSGHSSCSFARIGCKVFSYERNEEFFEITKKNISNLDVEVVVKHKDVYEGIEETNVDLVNFDLLEPWNALIHAEKALKSGGYLVCYLPNITQVIKLVEDLKNHNFFLWRVSEVLEREWIVENLRARPNNQMLGHTAFLVFARKI